MGTYRIVEPCKVVVDGKVVMHRGGTVADIDDDAAVGLGAKVVRLGVDEPGEDAAEPPVAAGEPEPNTDVAEPDTADNPRRGRRRPSEVGDAG